MKNNVLRRAGILTGCLALLGMFLAPHLARSTPPGLSAALSNSTNLQLTVTNSVAGQTYELYYTATLEAGYSWSWFYTGSPGQTNFTILGITNGFSGFFRAESGTDRDGDSIENYRDANPYDASINYPLTVIIETPLNGSTIY